MSAMAFQVTSVSIVCSAVCSGIEQRKHQRSSSLAFVREIHRWPMDSPHKGPVTRKMLPFDDVIMVLPSQTGGLALHTPWPPCCSQVTSLAPKSTYPSKQENATTAPTSKLSPYRAPWSGCSKASQTISGGGKTGKTEHKANVQENTYSCLSSQNISFITLSMSRHHSPLKYSLNAMSKKKWVDEHGSSPSITLQQPVPRPVCPQLM